MGSAARAAAGVLLAAALGGAAMVGGCDRREAPRPEGPLRVVVTIPPLKGLAEELLPEGGEVRSLIPPGRSEHGYELTPSDIAALERADVVVLIGLGLEPKVERFLNAHPRTTRQVVEFAGVVGIEGGGHDHHDQHDDHHHHGSGVDPHLWLDPGLVAQLIPALGEAISAAAADAGQTGEGGAAAERAEALEARVVAADARWRAALSPIQSRSIVTHHSAWGRLAERYGLNVAAVIRPIEAQEPSPGQVEAAVRAIREQGARAVFVEPQFDPALAERIAAQAGVAVGTLDPLGDGDWFAMMERNVATLAELLGDGSTAAGAPAEGVGD